MSERNLSIRVDDELFKRIKIIVATEGITLKEYLLELIMKDLERREK